MFKKAVPQDQAGLIKQIKAAGLNTTVTARNRKTAEKHDSAAVVYSGSVTKRHPDNEIIVGVACSSYEIYGPNSNGDGFPSEQPYPDLGIEEKDLLRNHYKSFERGQVYYMHNMQDPVGWIIKAFWNERYKWVEIVVELDHSRLDAGVLSRVKAGEMIFFSMGCNVEYDVCSICGHKSYGKNYCTHIKDRLLHVINNTIAAMLNPSPDFDDLSVVFIPAEAIAASLYRKVAGDKAGQFVKELSGKDTGLTQKVSKIAEIYKNTAILKGLKEFKQFYSPLVDNMSAGMKAQDIAEVLSFFYRAGIPMPVHAIAGKFNIPIESIIQAQSDIAARLINDTVLQQTLSGIVSAGTEEALVSGLTEAGDAIFTSRVDGKPDQKHNLAGLVAVFNILNKLSLMDKGVSGEMLPKDSPAVKDLERLIELEFLYTGE